MQRLTLSQRLRLAFTRRRNSLRQHFHQLRRRRMGYEQLEDRAMLATVTWDGGAGTFNFGDANNWDNNAVPSAANDYVIPDLAGSPTIAMAGTQTLRSLSSSEAIAMASGVFTVQTNSSLLNGMVLTGGTWNVGSGAKLTIQGTSQLSGSAALAGLGEFHNLGSLTLGTDFSFSGTFRNSANVWHNAGQMTLGSTGKWINEATGIYNAGATGRVSVTGNGGSVVNFGTILHNSGSFAMDFLQNSGLVENGSGTFELYEPSNSGTIRNLGGTINISGSGNTWTTFSGVIEASGGSAVNFSNVAIDLYTGTRFSGAGAFNASGTFYVHGSVAIDTGTTITFSSGQLRLIDSAPSISGGTIIVNGSTVTVDGYVDVRIDSNLQLKSGTINLEIGSRLTLGATTNWTGTGQISSLGTIWNQGLFTYAPTAA